MIEILAGIVTLVLVAFIWWTDRSHRPERPMTLVPPTPAACITHDGVIVDKIGTAFAQRIFIQLKGDPPYKLIQVTERYSNMFDVLQPGDEVAVADCDSAEPRLFGVYADLRTRRANP